MTKLSGSLASVIVALGATAWGAACASGEPNAALETGEGDASPKAELPKESPEAAASAASTCAKPCSVSAQCGCEATETCDVGESGAATCVSAGTAAIGLSCLTTRECAKGLVCSESVCRAPCEELGAACTGVRAALCGEYPKTATDAGTVLVRACAVTCDYADERSCGFDPKDGNILAAACVFREATKTAECMKVRTAQLQSGVCTADTDCGAGRVCTPSGGFSTCRRLCKVGDPAACGGCTAIEPARVLAGIAFGHCP